MLANLQAYLELSKPRIVTMVLVTTTIGFFLGGQGIHSMPLLFFTLMGTAYAAAGAAALNNVIECELDAGMERTRGRVLPSGKMDPASALAFGVCSVLLGVTILVWKVSLLTAFIVLLTAFLYVLVYTPMKRVSWLNTSIGAIPGALPPLTGWAAATGELGAGAWVLFLVLFAWQHPHFYSIAWMYRDDYGRANFKMLPVIEPSGKRTFRHAMAYAAMLLGVSLLPAVIGLAGTTYLFGAVVMGVGLFWMSCNFARRKSISAARGLLRATLVYLPVWLVLVLFDVVM